MLTFPIIWTLETKGRNPPNTFLRIKPKEKLTFLFSHEAKLARNFRLRKSPWRRGNVVAHGLNWPFKHINCRKRLQEDKQTLPVWLADFLQGVNPSGFLSGTVSSRMPFLNPEPEEASSLRLSILCPALLLYFSHDIISLTRLPMSLRVAEMVLLMGVFTAPSRAPGRGQGLSKPLLNELRVSKSERNYVSSLGLPWQSTAKWVA